MREDFILAARQFAEEYRHIGQDGKTTLFIGDSFFDKRFFWTNFDETFAGKSAICAGIGSTTTYEWIKLFPEYFSGISPENLVINLGTNNFYDVFDTTELAQKNLKELLAILCKLLPETHIYYFAISQRTDERFKNEVSETNTELKKWCSANGVKFIDTEREMTAEMLRDDGIHPKIESYDKEYVKRLLESGCVVKNIN